MFSKNLLVLLSVFGVVMSHQYMESPVFKFPSDECPLVAESKKPMEQPVQETISLLRVETEQQPLAMEKVTAMMVVPLVSAIGIGIGMSSVKTF